MVNRYLHQKSQSTIPNHYPSITNFIAIPIHRLSQRGLVAHRQRTRPMKATVAIYTAKPHQRFYLLPLEYESHYNSCVLPRGFVWPVASTPGCKNVAMLVFLPGPALRNFSEVVATHIWPLPKGPKGMVI